MSRSFPFITTATILVVLTRMPLFILHTTNQIAITLIADGVDPDLVHRACRAAANDVWVEFNEGIYDLDRTLIQADLIFRINLNVALFREE
jgi:hypothetical protein